MFDVNLLPASSNEKVGVLKKKQRWREKEKKFDVEC